jgi:hypothetical protein
LDNLFAVTNETVRAMEELSSEVRRGAGVFRDSIDRMVIEKDGLLSDLENHTATGDEQARIATMDRLKNLNKVIGEKNKWGFVPTAELQIAFEKLRDSLLTTEQLGLITDAAVKLRNAGQSNLGRCIVLCEMIAGYKNKKLGD